MERARAHWPDRCRKEPFVWSDYASPRDDRAQPRLQTAGQLVSRIRGPDRASAGTGQRSGADAGYSPTTSLKTQRSAPARLAVISGHTSPDSSAYMQTLADDWLAEVTAAQAQRPKASGFGTEMWLMSQVAEMDRAHHVVWHSRWAGPGSTLHTTRWSGARARSPQFD